MANRLKWLLNKVVELWNSKDETEMNARVRHEVIEKLIKEMK